ncbi:hypothetical protein EDB89DRAFT_2179677 [Lactarius sanguifluus]|nr:hypothetical protein EDB89DRAFT_2179677 [Lactarius sanguifluus]
MSELTLREFLDLEATVDDRDVDDVDEDVEDDELELNEFFADGTEESETAPSEGFASHDEQDLVIEASQLRAEASESARRSRQRQWVPTEVVPAHFLVPTRYDPDLWAVRVKAGHESSLVLQIFRKCILSREGRSLDIASVFARDGIPGYIFLEGSLPATSQVVRDLVTVRRNPPRLVPPEQRIGLLASRNPLSRRIAEGQWVRCVHGAYHGDVGFVCDWDPSSDLEVVVAFVPRIPHRTSGQTGCNTGKRKRPSRPLPRSWTSAQVAAEWGPARVQVTSPDVFKFQNDVYESGLVMKCYAPDSLVIVDGAPANLDMFMAAPCIRERSSFIPWIHRFAQDMIKERQRVIVESGEQKGVVGYVSEIVGTVATVVAASHVEDICRPPAPHVLLRNLAPHYLPGDNVKDRWRDSDGMVQSVNDEWKTLVYVERATHNQVNASMDFVEFFDPSRWFYTLKPGSWVEFHKPGDFQRFARRGYVRAMSDTLASVVDEHTWNEIEIDMRDVQVAGTQGPSLPKKDRVHPLVGQRVKVTHGNSKGYRALVKDVHASYVAIEVDAKLAGTSAPYAHIQWTDFVVVPKELEPTRSSPLRRLATPPPLTELDPSRALTPEPEMLISSPDIAVHARETHWLLSEEIMMQGILESKRIPMQVCGIKGSGDGSKDEYEGNTARTVPAAERTLTPRDGEVIVTVVKRHRSRQISINPSFLVPWDTVVGSEVVVINRPFLGQTGVVVGSEDLFRTVRTTFTDERREICLESKHLANLERIKKQHIIL